MGRSLLRFGTLELSNQPAPNGKAGPSLGDYDLLRSLADHILRVFYPEALETGPDVAAACPYGCRSWASYRMATAGRVWLDVLSLTKASAAVE